MPLSKSDRVAIIFQRVLAAPACGSADDMLAVLSGIMNSVEDEHSGATFDPTTWSTDGRLYPPQEDQRTAHSVNGVRRYRSKGHEILISEDGALRISRHPEGPVELNKFSAANTEVPHV